MSDFRVIVYELHYFRRLFSRRVLGVERLEVGGLMTLESFSC